MAQKKVDKMNILKLIWTAFQVTYILKKKHVVKYNILFTSLILQQKM
jgi:hypothetical protein